MNKDEIYELTIEDMTTDGEGIGHTDGGMAVFVKDALVGDRVRVKIIKVKKHYAYGRLMEILEASSYRVTPICGNARRCGGCAIMHMDYEKQKEYKWNKVRSCLERIGGCLDIAQKMEPGYGMMYTYAYRNKMQFPVGLDKDGQVKIGFYAGRTHCIIDMDECAIGHPVNNYLVKNLRVWLQERVEKNPRYIYDEQMHKGLVRHILTRVGFATGELMICVVINGESLSLDKKNETILNQSFVEVLEKSVRQYNESANPGDLQVTLKSVSVNVNREKTNRILGERCKTIWGEDTITDYIGDVAFRISPLSFYQVNPAQTKVLYDKALEYAALSGQETVWDMYCGIGTISLSLAKAAKKVYGVEIVPQAIVDAKENAKINHLSNVAFYCGKAETVVPEFMEGKLGDAEGRTPDVVVVDPPRKGCDEQLLSTILHMQPKRIVYVSCDPETLARDVKILCETEYQVEKVAVVDQFCHSTHVETICLLSRKVPV